MTLGVKRADPALRTVECPVADGGDGTLDTVLAAGFERIPVYAMGPTGQVTLTAYARSGDTAVVEMAEICGLQRLPGADAGTADRIQLRPRRGRRTSTRPAAAARSSSASAAARAPMAGPASSPRWGPRIRSARRAPRPGGEAASVTACGSISPACGPKSPRATFIIAADVDNPLYGPTGRGECLCTAEGREPGAGSGIGPRTAFVGRRRRTHDEDRLPKPARSRRSRRRRFCRAGRAWRRACVPASK